MSKKNNNQPQLHKIQLFEEKKVRTVWDDQQGGVSFRHLCKKCN